MAVTAAHQVLFTTELLEAILLCMPLMHILPLQRVCKGWRSVIEGSVKLQRVLFFLPIGPVENSPTPAFVLNPMTSSVYRQIMPYLDKSRFRLFSARMEVGATRENDPVFQKNASWRRMYLSQPPFQELALHSKAVGPHDMAAVSRRTTNRTGTTLGDFFQHCESVLTVCDKIDFNCALGWFQEFESYGQLKRLSK